MYYVFLALFSLFVNELPKISLDYLTSSWLKVLLKVYHKKL